MSNYRDFVQDFPGRCRDVLKAFAAESKRQDRDVTLLLMAATAGFVMPYERLGEGDAIKQPSLDRPKFGAQMDRLRNELAKKIHESVLFKDANWRGCPLQSAVGEPDAWPEFRKPQPPLSADTLVAEAVRYLRHGLSHGNVFSRGDQANQIHELVFVCGGTLRSGKEIPLKCLVLSPQELRQFLERWFEFVESLHVPHRSVLEVVDHAA